MSDLIKSLSELLDSKDLNRDYENVWEWIEGSSSELKSKINISREHDWKKGEYDKPLILTFDYRGYNKNKTVEKIGRKLMFFFNREVKFGTIYSLSNGEYDETIKQIFK